MHRNLTSRYLSFLLRHHPEDIGMELDEQGWVSIENLISCLQNNNIYVDTATINHIVSSDVKKRYTVTNDGKNIRAAQGHSISINLGMTTLKPPPILFHGTAKRFIDSIINDGIRRGSRQHVHLSVNKETALVVGSRHGQPKVISVDTGRMFADGLEFWLSENGIWLTEFVHKDYIIMP